MMREERAPETASICPACKSPVNASDRFCEKCGEKIPPALPSPPAQAPVCRSCGTPLQPGARFCENCGDPVKKAEAPVPSPLASAQPVSKEPALPRGLIVTEEPVAVAGRETIEDSGPENTKAVKGIDVAGPMVDEASGPEPAPEPVPWMEASGEVGAEPVKEPEPEFEEEPEEELVEEPEEEPAEALQGDLREEWLDEPEGPELVTEEPAPPVIPRKPRAGPVDELLLGLEPEEPTGPGPEKRLASATTTPQKEAAVKTPPRKPAPSKKTFLIIGFIAAILVIAIAFVALQPLLTGPGSSGTKVPLVQATPVATATTVVTTAPTPEPVETETAAPALAVPVASPAATETPEQVDILPPQYTLHFEEFKDVVTGDVTVTVTGPSRNVVKDIEVTVFHPDGTTDSDHLLPSQGMTEVTVTGTRSAERVVVTVLFYSGEQYTLIDRIVSFSRRT